MTVFLLSLDFYFGHLPQPPSSEHMLSVSFEGLDSNQNVLDLLCRKRYWDHFKTEVAIPGKARESST